MPETEGQGSTPPSGPTPEQVLAYFHRTKVRRRPVGPKQVTPEIREIAELLSPGVLAKQAADIARSGQAYYGAHLIAEPLSEHLTALDADIAHRWSALSDPIERWRAYDEACDEHRALRRLIERWREYGEACELRGELRGQMRALADSARSPFFQQGQFADIRKGGAVADRKVISIELLFPTVKLVLEQSGHRVSVRHTSAACKVTANLLTDFAQLGIVTVHSVSTRVRKEIKRKDKPWPYSQAS